MKSKCNNFLTAVSSFLCVLVVFLVTEVSFSLGANGRADAAEVEEFALFLEFNSTDGDLGLQGFLGADAWGVVRIIDPKGRSILAITTKKGLKKLGLSEFSFESEEPQIEEEDVRDRFPEGVYRLVGRTVDGENLTGEAELSHELPAAPGNLTPDGTVLDPNNPIVIAWDTGTNGETVAFWEVEVETDEVRVLSAVLDPATTQVTIPAEIIEPGKEYRFEVIAVGENGNRVITEVGFTTAP